MNNVPEGLCPFTTLDACGNVREGELWAEGFELLSNTTTILPNCGSFDVDLQYSSNSVRTVHFGCSNMMRLPANGNILKQECFMIQCLILQRVLPYRYKITRLTIACNTQGS